MLLRITYSNTKRFLKKTIQTFKSYFPRGYQRLPKTAPFNPFSCTINHFTHTHRQPLETTINHLPKAAAAIEKETHYDHHEGDHSKKEENKMMDIEKDEDGSMSKCLVTRKLKELEMMDRNNVDLVLDIEEVLHYYSQLTCPAYRDIVEKFFVEVYSGSFNLSRGNNSV